MTTSSRGFLIDFGNIDIDRALSAVAKELLMNRDNWEAWSAKADILYSMGLYENSILCCIRSLAINPHNTFTEATKAKALMKLNNRDKIQY